MMGFKRIGKNVTIWPQSKIALRESISIGDNVIIDDFAFIVGGPKDGPETKIGSYVHIASFVAITGGGEVILEDFTSYGSGTKLVSGSEHFVEADCMTNPTVPAPFRLAKRSFIHIKKHSMLGVNVTVMPGVTIGEGCVIGACSLVTKDCKPWGIYAGTPAKRIRERPREKILALEKELLAKVRREELERPLVSVSCLTYNQKNFIGKALDSFLMQKTSFPFEIVVHDDASTDGTAEIVREYAKKHPTIIKAIFQTENQFSKDGIYPVRFLLPVRKGKYVAECDGDDYWTDPLKLQKQFDFLEANPEYVMCHHDYVVEQDGKQTVPRSIPKDYSQEELIGYSLSGYGIGNTTKMWRNLYSPETKRDFENFVADYYLNVLMGTFGKCKYISGIKPSVYRRCNGSNSWCSLPVSEMNKKIAQMYQHIFDLISEKGNPRWTEIRRKFLPVPEKVERQLRTPPLKPTPVRGINRNAFGGSRIMPKNYR
jgi:galactoside O-acetyltransferase